MIKLHIMKWIVLVLEVDFSIQLYYVLHITMFFSCDYIYNTV